MKVSVIIPCFNARKYLGKCLASVSRQTHPDLEIIAVNDGSTDNTGDILEEWSVSAGSPISILETSNRGAAAARNLGLSHARSAYIQFLDADDLLLPDKISHQVNLAEKQAVRPDFIAAAYEERFKDGLTINQLPDRRDSWYGLISSSLGITSANLFKKSAVDRVNGFNAELDSSQEYDLMFRLMKQPESSVLRDYEVNTIKRSVNTEAISTRHPGENITRHIDLRRQMLNHLETTDKLSGELLQFWYQSVFCSIKRLHRYNPGESRRLFEKLLPKYFSPEVSGAVSVTYKRMFGLLGFRSTEFIYHLKSRILS